MSFSDTGCILDRLPTEIIENFLFQYLSCEDLSSLSTIGSKRLKDISEDYIQSGRNLHRNCKCDNLLFILMEWYGYSLIFYSLFFKQNI